MPREASLFEEAGGSPVRGYLLLKREGANVPPMWIERAKNSRRRRHKNVAEALKKGGASRILDLEDWELAYQKECFYHGIRVLFELERSGRSAL